MTIRGPYGWKFDFPERAMEAYWLGNISRDQSREALGKFGLPDYFGSQYRTKLGTDASAAPLWLKSGMPGRIGARYTDRNWPNFWDASGQRDPFYNQSGLPRPMWPSTPVTPPANPLVPPVTPPATPSSPFVPPSPLIGFTGNPTPRYNTPDDPNDPLYQRERRRFWR